MAEPSARRLSRRPQRCERCGQPIEELGSHPFRHECSSFCPPVLDDLTAARWVHVYDAAWLGEDWRRLEQCLAPDVQFTDLGASVALVGRDAVVASMRKLAREAQMHEYNATDLKGYSSGAVGVITYRWQLDCTHGHKHVAATGRDLLVLRATGDDWQLHWCTRFTA